MAALTQIFRLNAGIGDNFPHRNALAASVRKPGAALVIAATILLGDRLIIGRSSSQCAGHRVGHHLQQMANSRELAGIELVKQLMCVLFVHVIILAECAWILLMTGESGERRGQRISWASAALAAGPLLFQVSVQFVVYPADCGWSHVLNAR
jgi:hypothetical protein